MTEILVRGDRVTVQDPDAVTERYIEVTVTEPLGIAFEYVTDDGRERWTYTSRVTDHRNGSQ